ncbi:MAG: NAD-dependent epimerase/dehydratase family protein [Symploca sp. SIO3C6]|uniref:NAD-dependent epimerase/dehydratase family protein n=1 Tax=Symploca sp. SIO1C4 TaxID=2607765 RepID=A0A6B3NDN4_9CYAN|nr:NAD-dependent epimerase/dehydratase family protein [Symploca sp. SIO3C6]NER27248.1 NAD-dependent epimerase/dehydratase family protein [Symploca sp. SIO1C4]
MELKDKTILITGIGNYLGLRTAEMALERGMKVCGLEPSPEDAKKVQELGVEVIVGSTTEPEVLEKACQDDIDIVFHTENMIDPGGPIEPFRQVNVVGTVNAATAAKKAGVKTFVHISTVMVYGFKFPKQVTEDGPLRSDRNPLCQSKIEAEQEILKFNNPPELGVIIIRPGDIYGPGAYTWVLQPLDLMEREHFVLVNGGRGILNHVYLDNLIDACFLAIEKEMYGEAFNITDGVKTTCEQFYNKLAQMTDHPKPMSMPAIAVKTALQVQGKEIGLMPEAVNFLTRSHTYSIEKAQRLLGYEPKINLDEGMARTIACLPVKL